MKIDLLTETASITNPVAKSIKNFECHSSIINEKENLHITTPFIFLRKLTKKY